MCNQSWKLIAGLALIAGCGTSAAQKYPNKPIRLVVCFPTGSPSDLLGRLLGQRLGDTLGQSFVIDNKPGAGGVVGADVVAKAAPDGYTLLMCGIGPLAISPGLIANIPFEPLRDFAPVTLVASVPYLLVVSPSLPADSVKALVALAKETPGRLNYASAGIGSAGQLASELFKNLTKTDMLHVAYRGVAPALSDLSAGQVHMMIAGITAFLPHIKSGRLKPLGVASTSRSPLLPNVPTIIEAGVPGFTASGWTGLEAPRRTPADIVVRLNREVLSILKVQEVRDSMLVMGAEPIGNQPAEFAAYMRDELAKWTRVIRALGIKEEI